MASRTAPGEVVKVIYETIQQKPSELSLHKACNTLSVSRNGYMQWLARKLRPPPKWEATLLKKIQAIKEEFAYYGYRRVVETLNDKVTVANHKTVFRLMQEHHWTVKKKRFRPKTTQSNPSDPRFPNLAQDVALTDVNQVWDSDITYVPFNDGFLYLALLTDRYSKKCVGWQLSRNCDSRLCEDALQKAFKTRKGVSLEGMIHHGDHGSQYLSAAY
ncbi:MAG: IS3 family transposase, partial [Bacteroidota bacterium]